MLTKSDGSTTTIASGDVAALATLGVTFAVSSESDSAILKIDNSDKSFYGASLSLTIKDTIQDEDDFANTTKVNIVFIRPACPVTKEFLASQTDVVLSLTAK